MKPSALDAIDRRIAVIERQVNDLKLRLEDLQKKRATLLSLPDTCLSCGGTGRERYTDEAGSSDWRECLTCRGLGKIGLLRCASCGRVAGTDMIFIRRQTSYGAVRCPWCGGVMDHDTGQGD